MQYQKVKGQLELVKLDLVNKTKNPNLSIKEKENIEKQIDNYEYIIQLTDMNHFGRGSVIH